MSDKIINFFNLEKFDTAQETELVLDNDTERLIGESNLRAKIPARFWKSRLGDYEITFLDDVKDFALADVSDNVFMLNGNVGTGKTTLLTSCIHERAVNEKDCGLYLSMRLLMPMLRTSRSFSAKESELDLYEKYSTTPFLCLDEVGTSGNIQEESEFLRTLFATRYDHCLRTMVATNLNAIGFKLLLLGKSMQDFNYNEKTALEYLEKTNKDPILDRIRSVIKIKSLVGESHRGEKQCKQSA